MSARSSGRRHAAVSMVAAAAVALVVCAGCSGGTRGGAAAAPPAAATTSPNASRAGPTASRDPGISLGEAGLPTLQPEAVRHRVPTRVVVPALDIDLPIVAPAVDTSGRFPWCNVAEFLPSMSRPGHPGTTFLYAHARNGMFLPILVASQVRDGQEMLGMRVEVFSSDDRRFTYEVVEVLRHALSIDFAYRATAEQLILQTSEGTGVTAGKTMLVARPVDEAAASPAEARPEASPVACR